MHRTGQAWVKASATDQTQSLNSVHKGCSPTKHNVLTQAPILNSPPQENPLTSASCHPYRGRYFSASFRMYRVRPPYPPCFKHISSTTTQSTVCVCVCVFVCVCVCVCVCLSQSQNEDAVKKNWHTKGALIPKNPFTVTLMKPKMNVCRSHSIRQCHSLFNVSASMQVNFLLNGNVFLTLLAAFLEKGIFVRDKSLCVGGKIITNFCLPKTHGNN